MRFLQCRPLLALCAIAAAVVLITAETADARGRVSSGSRGTRTFTAPPTTNTAPTPARPIERTMTQPAQPGATAAARPTATGAGGGFFNRPGLLGGLAAGFLGAGLFGLLMGHGLFGGLGGLASIFGLVLQIGIVVAVAALLWRWWQRRSQPAFAGGPSLRDVSADARPRPMLGGSGQGLGNGLGLGGAVPSSTAGSDAIGTTKADFDDFEQLLGTIQTAYGQEDLGRLRAHATPEMVSYFAAELAENASRGVVNRITDVKLEQGDLAEAWREGDLDYVSVAMRYTLNDQMVERASGRVVEGGPDEATEVWTFMRVRGGAWLLTAIQQV